MDAEERYSCSTTHSTVLCCAVPCPYVLYITLYLAVCVGYVLETVGFLRLCGIVVFWYLGLWVFVVLSSASGSSEIWVSRNILAREAVGPAPWPPVVFAGLVGSSQKYLLVGGQGGIEPVVLLALNA